MDPFDDRLDRAAERLRDAVPELVVVYLFGSANTGTERRDSDVDLAVLLEDGQTVDPERRWSLQGELADIFRGDVDLVDLGAASVVMRAQVVRTGRVVFERDEMDRYRFEVTALTMYADLNVQRRDILNDIRERGSVYGG